MFEFSRGAYTVRSLTGMLSICGLATTLASSPPAEHWGEIDRLYDNVYRPARGQSAATAPYPRVPIRFLGVWDTVGLLGIPDTLGVLNLFDVEDRHRFHNTRLNALIEHARHAVALDETRGPFTPTLWTGGPAPGDKRSMRQVWFPGDHCDVGGGHLQTGLSDAALQWMIDEASACTGLSFRKEMLKQLQPNPADVLHDSRTGVYLHLGPVPRAVPLIDEQNSSEIVHSSVFARQACPPITVGQYRTSRELQPGESANCEVYASRPWNAMGLYLERGRYTFQAKGEWLDRGVPVDPGDTWDGRFHPRRCFNWPDHSVGGYRSGSAS